MANWKMPAEWAPHSCCWMAWPRSDADWPLPMQQVYPAFVKLFEAIRQFEPVRMVVDPRDMAIAARMLPADTELLGLPLDDCWMRDIGPTFVQNERGQLAGVDWQFNGWGKFPHQRDARVAQAMLEHLGLPRVAADWVNEGGAIHVNGAGTCLLTRTVQLNPNRNPGLSQQQVEQRLQREIGASDFIWLEQGLIGDDTDGHVDELACFTAPNRLVAAVAQPGCDNQNRLQDNLNQLEQWAARQPHRVEILTLELPPAAWCGDLRLSRSYLNFYIANGGLVVPRYGEPGTDDKALETLQHCFPDRTLVQVDCSVLVTGGGNIHCLTQQQPLAAE